MGDFYPHKLRSSEMLAWYGERFSTVEVNNSFYRLPSRTDFHRWSEVVSEDFCFSVKASRYITHRKRLHDAEAATRKFISHAEVLGAKLGPILFQLPPNWRGNPERLDAYLQTLPKSHRYVFEFRDERWYVPEIYTILKRHQIALYVHDWHALPWPVKFTADFTYIRFHGPAGTYGGSYSEASLQRWAESIRYWRKRLSRVFLYFNNDQQGHAVRNAQFLRTLLQENPKLKAA
jgi:uncharacterized protein YecE (DUF72 family)